MSTTNDNVPGVLSMMRTAKCRKHQFMMSGCTLAQAPYFIAWERANSRAVFFWSGDGRTVQLSQPADYKPVINRC